MPPRERAPRQPRSEAVNASAIPGTEHLAEFHDAVDSTPQVVIALARVAAERGAGTLAAKAASTRRELARATAAGASRERLARLRAQAATYADQAALGAERLKTAKTLERIGSAYGQRPAAYGRAVDERGRPHADLPVALVTERGETLAEGRTDEDGYFAISVEAPVAAAGDVLLRVGEGGALGSFAVTSRGRLLPPREIRVSGRRVRVATEPPKKD